MKFHVEEYLDDYLIIGSEHGEIRMDRYMTLTDGHVLDLAEVLPDVFLQMAGV